MILPVTWDINNNRFIQVGHTLLSWPWVDEAISVGLVMNVLVFSRNTLSSLDLSWCATFIPFPPVAAELTPELLLPFGESDVVSFAGAFTRPDARE
jgi:hypothetical protein